MLDWSVELRPGSRNLTAYETTMSYLLKFVVATAAVSELCIGSVVIRKLFAGVFLEQWTNAFMSCCLTASILALFLPFDTSLPVHKIAASAMIVVAGSALVWGRFRWEGISILVSALSIILILCLNSIVAVSYVFDYLSNSNLLPWAHVRLLFIIVGSLVILAFTVLGGILIRWFDDEKIQLL